MQFVNEGILRRIVKGLRKPCERIVNGMIFEPYFEQSSKWTNLVFQLRISPSAKKSIDFVDKVPTVFSFAVIISTVGSYQVRVYFTNNS